ncbi:hypothetical protein [Bacillus sp. AK128]
MTVNHAGVLRKEYFQAYLMLVITSRQCTLEEAKDITFNLFFQQDPKRYGPETYHQFILAYQGLTCGSFAC